ncbi:MAG: biopolymer transporter ExbD [Candidatus Nitricoxidivorans perseverans]|uniref:Biopolymer transporter ExbD n=1 Tax=Candidatus Nitricoxidivorans perseverans TaxID=2975601 RepID=A0AA49FM83_9PROT|nr:MAG: biopolymer transporter ExbD [Candidatus Nitricoxidivorans perseverans]
MKFQKGRGREEPEINLIPMIDVLLVILIFLMITTTYSKFAGLEINLPTADAQAQQERPNEIDVVVTAAGEVLVNKVPVAGREVEAIGIAMKRAAGAGEPVVIINADAKAAHQSVIDVMQAAQQSGLTHISFATQQKN